MDEASNGTLFMIPRYITFLRESSSVINGYPYYSQYCFPRGTLLKTYQRGEALSPTPLVAYVPLNCQENSVRFVVVCRYG